MNTRLQAVIEKVKELRKVMQDQGKEAVKDAFAEFFQNHPEAKAIVWVQYTPYFNDGDACEFSVRELELKANTELLSEDVSKFIENHGDSYSHGDDCLIQALQMVSEESVWKNERRAELGVTRRDLTVAEQSLVDDFDSLQEAANLMDEVFELVFGDHVEVTATRDGFDVVEYDHD